MSGFFSKINNHVFNKFLSNSEAAEKKSKKLRKLIVQKHTKTMSFGVKKWNSSKENSVRYDLK